MRKLSKTCATFSHVSLTGVVGCILFASASGCSGDGTSAPDAGARADASKQGIPDAKVTTIDAALAPDGCVPRAWFPDCDGDGAPAAGAIETEACTRPAQPPSSCLNQSLAKWTLIAPTGLLASDCDDDDDQVGVAGTHYVDCDGDGFAPSTAGSVTACDLPPASATCSDSNGTWTSLQPVGPAYDAANLSVDCVDSDEQVRPEVVQWSSTSIAGAEPGREFDYNCDGETNRRYGSFYTCSLTSYGQGFACTHAPGYTASTACGVEGSYRSGCSIPGGSSCTHASISPKVQECR